MAIKNPTNVEELQIFLGMVNYYAKFIKKYADVVGPLYDLLKKNVKWVWTQKHDAKNSLKS